MKVVLSDNVRAFLQHERRYLGQYSRTAYRRLLARLKQATSLLSRFPESGPSAPNSLLGSRRLVIGDYVLFYDIDATEVHVVAMKHGKQHQPLADEQDFDFEA